MITMVDEIPDRERLVEKIDNAAATENRAALYALALYAARALQLETARNASVARRCYQRVLSLMEDVEDAGGEDQYSEVFVEVARWRDATIQRCPMCHGGQ
jgi:hypothetical protein